jgi:hypothetical protein
MKLTSRFIVLFALIISISSSVCSYSGKWIRIDSAAIPYRTDGYKYLLPINEDEYLLACNDSKLIMKFNTKSNTWTEVITNDNGLSCFGMPVFIKPDKLLFFGSTPYCTEHNQMKMLNLTTKQWEEIIPDTLPSKRFSHSLVKLDDYKILLTGGEKKIVFTDGGRYLLFGLGDTWIYHLIINKWQKLDSVPAGASNANIVYLGNNKLFVFGGFHEDLLDGNHIYFQLCYIVDLIDGKIETIIPKNSVPILIRPAVTMLDSNKILIFGGLKFYTSDSLGSTNETWIIDITKKTIEKIETEVKPSPRILSAIASNGNGVAYLYGGGRISDVDTWKFILDDPNAVANIENDNPDKLRLIYTNTNQLTIELDESEPQAVTIQFFEPNGRLISDYNYATSVINSFNIDVSSLSQGVYFVNVKANNKVYTDKFILYY